METIQPDGREGALTLEERKVVYAEARIAQQRSWYRDKADWNGRRANLLGLTTLLFEALR
jgi:hypothetical protein